jgi:hypothetical protein
MKSDVHMCRLRALAGAGTQMRPTIPDRSAEGDTASRLPNAGGGVGWESNEFTT